jgi:polygalacturonase
LGDGKTLNDGALAAALAACSSAGGGNVSLTTEAAVANSTFLFAAPVWLVSNVTLIVESGVTLTFTNFSADWPTKPGLPSYGAGLSYVPLLYGLGVAGAGRRARSVVVETAFETTARAALSAGMRGVQALQPRRRNTHQQPVLDGARVG